MRIIGTLLLGLFWCQPFLLLGESRPNILWIIGEDASPDLGCYGVEAAHTPNIDRLASEGMRFTQAFMSAGVCAAARTALHTGMYQTAIGAHQMRTPQELARPLPDGVRPLPEWFSRAGYFTANVKDQFDSTGKTDWSFKVEPRHQFDSDKWTDLKENQPFFAEINFTQAHRDEIWTSDYVRPTKRADPNKIKLPPYYPDHPVVRNDWATYLDYVNALDQRVGAVLMQLEKDGLADNTIVVFLTDHGRPMTRAKTMLYDSGIQIPLIIRWPKSLEAPAQYKPDHVYEALVAGIDLTATTLSFAGIEKPAKMQGRVFMGPKAESPRKYVYAATDRIGEFHHGIRCVRSERYKYILNRRDTPINDQASAYRKAFHPVHHLLKKLGRENRLNPTQRALVEPLPKEELYDLEVDPFEIINLATSQKHRTVLNEMRNVLDTWIAETDDHGLKPDSPELVKHFEAYGEMSSASRADRYQALSAKIAREDEAYLMSLK